MEQSRVLEERLEEARRLARAGRDADAKTALLAVLEIDPAHFGALTDLAGLALATGYRSAALTAYRQAAEMHPRNPIGLVNLANVLLEDGQTAEARELYENALAIDAGLVFAHQGLGNVFARLGDDGLAAHHRDLGFKGHHIVVRPFRGTGPAPRVLLLVSVKGGNIPINVILDDRNFALTALYAEYDDGAMPEHDVVFNAVGDADLCGAALAGAARVAARTTRQVINPPERIIDTGRAANARLLARCPEVIAPRVQPLLRAEIERTDAAEKLVEQGWHFPLLLRTPGFHTGQNFARVEDAAQLRAAALDLPGKELLAIEYRDVRGTDGLFRKYRVMFIGGELYPLHLALSHSWKVHYFTSAMAESVLLREEEARFLADMPAAIGARALRGLEQLRDILALDYGGADFAVDTDGRLVLFEANATMAIVPPGPEPMWDYRRDAVGRAIMAAREMIGRKCKFPSDDLCQSLPSR